MQWLGINSRFRSQVWRPNHYTPEPLNARSWTPISHLYIYSAHNICNACKMEMQRSEYILIYPGLGVNWQSGELAKRSYIAFASCVFVGLPSPLPCNLILEVSITWTPSYHCFDGRPNPSGVRTTVNHLWTICRYCHTRASPRPPRTFESMITYDRSRR